MEVKKWILVLIFIFILISGCTEYTNEYNQDKTPSIIGTWIGFPYDIPTGTTLGEYTKECIKEITFTDYTSYLTISDISGEITGQFSYEIQGSKIFLNSYYTAISLSYNFYIENNTLTLDGYKMRRVVPFSTSCDLDFEVTSSEFGYYEGGNKVFFVTLKINNYNECFIAYKVYAEYTNSDIYFEEMKMTVNSPKIKVLDDEKYHAISHSIVYESLMYDIDTKPDYLSFTIYEHNKYNVLKQYKILLE